MTDTREILSALIDGEAVDADVVAGILENPESRALMADFLRLRTSVQADGQEEPQWSGERFGTTPKTGVGTWLRVAAVLALLATGAVGGTWVKAMLTRERPPDPTRIVQLQLVNNH